GRHWLKVPPELDFCVCLAMALQGHLLEVTTFRRFPSYSGAFNITGILTVSGDGDGADARQVLGYFFEGADPLCDVKHGDVGAAA
ncbi:unnamed protein product, partial [Prorocentrum cordatum]